MKQRRTLIVEAICRDFRQHDEKEMKKNYEMMVLVL